MNERDIAGSSNILQVQCQGAGREEGKEVR